MEQIFVVVNDLGLYIDSNLCLKIFYSLQAIPSFTQLKSNILIFFKDVLQITILSSGGYPIKQS